MGSGPAGYSAGLYSVRANLDTLLFKGNQPGGALTTTLDVENFIGLDKENGFDLVEKFRIHAESYGLQTREGQVDSVEKVPTGELEIFKIQVGKEVYHAKTVIVATGATAKRLGVQGEELFWNKGISACATCDGALPMFRNKVLVVVGGGDTACEEALFLSRFASKVLLIHRRDRLRASPIMQDRIRNNSKIEMVWNTCVIEVMGVDLLNSIRCQNVITKAYSVVGTSGLFYAIGHVPNSQCLHAFDREGLVDDQGYIITEPGSTRTVVSGLFAAGDVADKVYRQAITSAGTGCMAALDVSDYLQ